MKYAPIVIVIAGWLIAAVLIAIGWHDMIDSVTHESLGLLPTGFMGIMLVLTGLGCGLAGNGISSALRPLIRTSTAIEPKLPAAQ
jgi:hypothetical protein